MEEVEGKGNITGLEGMGESKGEDEVEEKERRGVPIKGRSGGRGKQGWRG